MKTNISLSVWHVPEETSNTATYCRWWQCLITSSLRKQQIIINAKFYILSDSSTFEPSKSKLRKWMWRSTVLRRLLKLTKFDYECLTVWSSDLDKVQVVECVPTMPNAIGMPTTARYGMLIISGTWETKEIQSSSAAQGAWSQLGLRLCPNKQTTAAVLTEDLETTTASRATRQEVDLVGNSWSFQVINNYN